MVATPLHTSCVHQCKARVLNDGHGGQCKKMCPSTTDFCQAHAKVPTSKEMTGGPGGTCKKCRDKDGNRVVHTATWQHLGRHDGEFTLSTDSRWKHLCGDTPLESLLPHPPADSSIMGYLDGESLDDIKEAFRDLCSTEATSCEVAVELEESDGWNRQNLRWLQLYIEDRSTMVVATPEENTGEDTDTDTEETPYADRIEWFKKIIVYKRHFIAILHDDTATTVTDTGTKGIILGKWNHVHRLIV